MSHHPTEPRHVAETEAQELKIVAGVDKEAESQLEAIVYRLKKPQNFDELIQDITRNVEPNRWRSVSSWPRAIVGNDWLPG